MKIIRIGFCGFWEDFNLDNNLIVNILRKHFEVKVCNLQCGEQPEFLICSPLGNMYQYMKYDCPRIMYTGEPLAPDFSVADYFIGYDYCELGDRYLRYPLYIWDDKAGISRVRKPLTEDEAYDIVKKKKYFCNYIYGHKTITGDREKLFEKLSMYKKITSAGKLWNNMPNGKVYNMGEKPMIIADSKFTITGESICYPGFTSEKIDHAFRYYSIPIYCGNPMIGNEFNEEAFVNCEKLGIDRAVEKVIEIDTHDDLAVHMLCQYQYIEEKHEQKMYDRLADFLVNIFSQDPEEAYRRPRYYVAGRHERCLQEYNEYLTSLPYRVWKKLKK